MVSGVTRNSPRGGTISDAKRGSDNFKIVWIKCRIKLAIKRFLFSRLEVFAGKIKVSISTEYYCTNNTIYDIKVDDYLC